VINEYGTNRSWVHWTLVDGEGKACGLRFFFVSRRSGYLVLDRAFWSDWNGLTLPRITPKRARTPLV